MKASIPYIVVSTVLFVPYVAKADSLSFTYEELVVLTDDVMPLLDLIASGEGDYNSVNRGRAGDSPGDWAQTHLGKSITEMSIKEVRQHQGGRTSDCWYNGTKGKANLFAVGRYQLIPCTLQYATASIDNLDVRMLYEPDVQDAFGVFLLFVKRPVLGEYLLGEHNDLQEAGQELAKEFASVPIQYSNGRCKRGQSYYCGDKAGNKSHIAIEDVNKVLKQVRNNLDGHTDVQHMVKIKREKKRGLRNRIGNWWRKLWNRQAIPEPKRPLVNTMDNTLFDYIYPSESNKPKMDVPLELQQVPATNLGTSLTTQMKENEHKTDSPNDKKEQEPSILSQELPNPNPEKSLDTEENTNVDSDIPTIPKTSTKPSTPSEDQTPEDDVVDPRITPQNNKTP